VPQTIATVVVNEAPLTVIWIERRSPAAKLKLRPVAAQPGLPPTVEADVTVQVTASPAAPSYQRKPTVFVPVGAALRVTEYALIAPAEPCATCTAACVVLAANVPAAGAK
jgi:hypothetical protein